MLLVIAKFDTDASNEVVVKPFHEFKNAVVFAEEQRQEFLSQIYCDGAVDDEWTYLTITDDSYQYYGMSKFNSTETVTIWIEEAEFGDKEVK